MFLSKAKRQIKGGAYCKPIGSGPQPVGLPQRDQILITDAAGLPWEVLSTAVSQWSDLHKSDKIPLLVYPSRYFEEKEFLLKKYYNLWIIDGHYAREYSEYMMENSKLRIRFLIRFLIKRYLKP